MGSAGLSGPLLTAFPIQSLLKGSVVPKTLDSWPQWRPGLPCPSPCHPCTSYSPLHLQAVGSGDGGPGTHCRSGVVDIPLGIEALGSRGHPHSLTWRS